MTQFNEPPSKKGKCPICGRGVIIRSTRSKDPNYCSQVCASQERYSTRYKGTAAGPMDRPTKVSRTKLS